MELEKLRQQQAQMIADAEQRGQESQRQIMQAHKEVTEKLASIATDQGEASARQEKSNTRFNRLFLAIGLFAVLLALAPLAYPDGVGPVVDHAPWAVEPRSQPIVIVLPSPVASDEPTLTPTPSLGSSPGMASPQPQPTP